MKGIVGGEGLESKKAMVATATAISAPISHSPAFRLLIILAP
jgi:hypothetical protein